MPWASLAIPLNGRMLAVGGHWADRVSLYDLRTGRTQVLRLTQGQLDPYSYYMSAASVSFCPDARTLVSGGLPENDAVGANSSLNLWDARTTAHLRLFAQGSSRVPPLHSRRTGS